MQNTSPATAACLLFLFLLLLPPASPQCRAATDAECWKSDSFISGYRLAGEGFDITTLEFSKYSVFNLDEWQNPGGTCTLCENPLLQGKPRQKLPLGITNWTAIACQQEVQHAVTLSCISLADAVSKLFVRNDWKKDLDVEPDPSTYTQYALAGTDSDHMSFCKQKTQEDKYIFLLHYASCSYYKFSIRDNWLLSTTFNNTINALPEKYDSTSHWDYYKVIQSYGTHFMKELNVGALIWYLSGIQGCRLPLESFTVSEISRCLEIEAGVLIGLEEMTKNPDFQKCKRTINEGTFQFLVSNYIKHIAGGLPSLDFSNQAYNFPEPFKRWRESAKSLPALLSTSIEPLHTLVDAANPRRESLRQAVSEYVRRATLLRNCALPCPPGVQLSAWDPCSCECPDNNLTNSMCCSQQRGLAKLTVTILRAEGLRGDLFTPSDGYVSVSFKSKTLCTPTVWNNNNPRWDVSLDMGIFKLTEDFTKVKIEVWDEDHGWDDDRLGTCMLTLTAWDIETERDCMLRHGRIYYKGYLVCGYHLGGPSCRDYLPMVTRGEEKNSRPIGKAV